jgi:hypothetical protein
LRTPAKSPSFTAQLTVFTFRLMQKITVGQLRVLTFPRIYTFPAPNEDSTNTRPDLKAELRVVNDAFWIRLCTMGDLGFAEAYMYGDVVCDDLVTLFHVGSSVFTRYLWMERSLTMCHHF